MLPPRIQILHSGASLPLQQTSLPHLSWLRLERRKFDRWTKAACGEGHAVGNSAEIVPRRASTLQIIVACSSLVEGIQELLLGLIYRECHLEQSTRELCREGCVTI